MSAEEHKYIITYMMADGNTTGFGEYALSSDDSINTVKGFYDIKEYIRKQMNISNDFQIFVLNVVEIKE